MDSIKKNRMRLIPGVGTYWGDIAGNISEQTDLVDYISTHGGGRSAVWGNITGNLSEQVDLMEKFSSYATLSDIPSLEGYATESWVSGQGYMTESSMSAYVLKNVSSGDAKMSIRQDSLPGIYMRYSINSQLGIYPDHISMGGSECTAQIRSNSFGITGSLNSLAGIVYNHADLSGEYAFLIRGSEDKALFLGIDNIYLKESGSTTSIPYSGIATQSWVSGQGYLTSTSLKTINDESIIGEGNIEIGGLTPEQEAAIEPLENTEEGVFYTNEIPAESVYLTSIPISDNFFTRYASNINGETYVCYGYQLYKFDKVGLTYIRIGSLTTGSSSVERGLMFSLPDGKVVLNGEYLVNLETGHLDPIDLNLTDIYWSYENRDNIIQGNDGVYCVSTNGETKMKYNESTEQFETFDIRGNNSSDIITMSQYRNYYEGHIVCVCQNWETGVPYMCEFIEHDDYAEVVVVDNPYYPMIITLPDLGDLQVYELYNIRGTYFCVVYNHMYKLVNNVWTVLNFYVEGNDLLFTEYGSSTGDLFIGGTQLYWQYTDTVVNPLEKYTISGWTKVSSVAVDVKSDQIIKGDKNFLNGIRTPNILDVQTITGNSAELTITNPFDKLTLKGKSVSIESGNALTLNEEEVATIDKCIVNVTETAGGPKVRNVYTLTDDMNAGDRRQYFTTHTGRLFYITNSGDSIREFNGSQFGSPISLSVTLNPRNYKKNGIFTTTNNTFLVKEDYTYIWDDTNTQFVQICSSPGSYIPAFWVCDVDTIRFEETKKLVYDNGSWSWVDDICNDYPGVTISLIDNNTVYILNGGGIYTWDETNKTATLLYQLWFDTNYMYGAFIMNGNMYLKQGDNVMYLVDYNNQQFVATNFYTYPYYMYNVEPFDFIYVVYNNKLYTVRRNDVYNYGVDFVETYTANSSVPEVPATNGTYVLKAVRNNSGVTYSWVLDEVAQAVQITNEILS